MQNARLDDLQAGIKIAGRNISNLRYADDTRKWQKAKRNYKSFLMRVKEENDKAGLKLNIKKLRSWHLVPSLMASRWGTSGNSDRFYIPVLQNHCGWWLQPWSYKKLAPWKKSYDKPTKRIKKQRYYFPNKSPSSKAMVFPVVMYGWEIWVIKKAEHQRIDAFELWCWRRLLRVPWTARRSNQSILKEINPEYSLEGLMLKLKFQYFGHLMQRNNSLKRAW